MPFTTDKQRKGFFSRLFNKRQIKIGIPPPPPSSWKEETPAPTWRDEAEEESERIFDKILPTAHRDVTDDDIRKAAVEWERIKQEDIARDEIDRYKARKEIIKYKKIHGGCFK